MAKPPCRKFLLNKNLQTVVLGSSLLWFFLCTPFGMHPLYGKDQHQISRLTNNKTFYATEIPFLNPAPTLITMRHVPTHEPISMAFDLVNAKKLAEIAKKAPYKNTHGRCLAWVRKGLSKLLGLHKATPLDLNSLPNDPIKPNSPKRNFSNKGFSAENFKNWVLNNPTSLCQNLKLANVTEYTELAPHEGVIYVYGKGRCGFHRRYGHIEVLTDAKKGEACSDHCRIITQPCSPDIVLAPVTNCEWIARDEKKEHRPMLKPLTDPKPMLMSKYIERPSLAK